MAKYALKSWSLLAVFVDASQECNHAVFSFGSAVSGAGSNSQRSPKINSGAGRDGRVEIFLAVKVGMVRIF